MVRFLRRFMHAEIMEELALLRAEVAALRRETMLREDIGPVVRQMEAALLAIALSANTTERHEVQGEEPELR
jgi:hypothetical protein